MDFSKRYSYLAGEVLKEHAEVFARQDLEELEKWIDAVAQAERIFVVGAGREGIAARSFSMRLMHLGKTVHWVWDDTAPGMGKEDLLIVVNGSGKIGHIDYLMKQAGEVGASIAAVTGAPKEKGIGLADYVLFVPACVYKGRDERAAASIQPMGNLFEQHLFLLFDIIILLLMEKLGLTPQEMEKKHRNIE